MVAEGGKITFIVRYYIFYNCVILGLAVPLSGIIEKDYFLNSKVALILPGIDIGFTLFQHIVIVPIFLWLLLLVLIGIITNMVKRVKTGGEKQLSNIQLVIYKALLGKEDALVTVIVHLFTWGLLFVALSLSYLYSLKLHDLLITGFVILLIFIQVGMLFFLLLRPLNRMIDRYKSRFRAACLVMFLGMCCLSYFSSRGFIDLFNLDLRHETITKETTGNQEDVYWAIVAGRNFIGAKFDGASLYRTNFTNTVLDNASFKGAYLGDKNYRGNRSVFAEAKLYSVDFEDAHLFYSNFVNVQRTDSSNFLNTEIEAVDFTGADLEFVKNLTATQFFNKRVIVDGIRFPNSVIQEIRYNPTKYCDLIKGNQNHSASYMHNCTDL